MVYFSYWFPYFYKRIAHPFRPIKCLIEVPFHPDWEIEPPSPEKKAELISVLRKPFTYLSKGKQSYVFLSQDKKIVLKLFRFDTCKVPFGQALERQIRKWVRAPENHFSTTEFKINKNFTSCKLCYDLAQNQTGVVFVHLNPKPTDLPTFTVKDRFGRNYRIDPEKYRFILQKKAEPLRSIFWQKNFTSSVDSYFNLLDEIAALGLVNLDIKLESNYGLLDGRAIVLDVGNFAYDPDQAVKQKEVFALRMNLWLEKRRVINPLCK